jgi:hypothetical protein
MHQETTVATHFLGAIYMGRIHKLSDFSGWYARLLAHVQRPKLDLDDASLLNGVVDHMKKFGMIKVDDEGNVKVTNRGKIAAQMLFDPYELHQAIRNWYTYLSLPTRSDVDLVIAVGTSYAWSAYCSVGDSYHISQDIKKANPGGKDYWKAQQAIYNMLKRQEQHVSTKGLSFKIKGDCNRVCQALMRATLESETWGKQHVDLIQCAFIRIKKGVTWEQASLELKRFTKTEARALASVGILTYSDAKANAELASTVIKPDRMMELGI